MLKRIIENRSS